MNKLYATMLAALVTLPMLGQSKTVPYSSDIGVNNAVDPEWETVNNTRGANGFTWDRQTTDFSTPGTLGGVYHAYDSDYAADCWVMSPMITLTAGTQYTVKLWTKTRGLDSEKYEVRMASERTSAAMKAGTQLIRNEDYLHSSDFELQQITVTVPATGDYSFGIHCFSDANSYDFYVTGFSITGEGGDQPDPGPTPSTAKALPYEDDFSSETTFAADWKSVAGPDAATTAAWSYNSYSKYAEFDSATGIKEDNWLVSPAINFDTAGEYMLKATCTIYGDLGFALGTSDTDMSGYTELASYEGLTEFNKECEVPFTVTTPGNYHIAFHAKAETGTYMGYRINYVKVLKNDPVPALVTDLTAAPQGEELKVNLTWTNPAVDQKGNALTEPLTVKLYRNGEQFREISNCTAGAAQGITDQPEAAGVYSYYVMAYNGNGCIDSDPITVNAGYVGHPVAAMPYAFDATTAGENEYGMFTVLDGNADGNTWVFDAASWSKSFMSKMPADTEANEYLATPYLQLPQGYYRIKVSINARFNSYQIGYATDRHNIASTFTRLDEVEDVQEYGYQTREVVMDAYNEGEYVIVVRHIGTTSSSAYSDIKVQSIEVNTQAVLPEHVLGLRANVLENKSVSVEWQNPTLDIARRNLDDNEPLGYTVYCDGTAIHTEAVSSLHTPGIRETYVASDLTPGMHKFSVVIRNANGEAEGEAPYDVAYTGDFTAIPYITTDFTGWQVVSETSPYNTWTRNEETSLYSWSKYYGDPDPVFLTSPYFKLEDGRTYIVKVTATTGDEDMQWLLGAAKAADPMAMYGILTATTPAGTTTEHSFKVKAKGATPYSASDGDNDETVYYMNPESSVFSIAPLSLGKVTVNAFSIDYDIDTAVDNICDEGGMTYRDDMLHIAGQATGLTVCDLAGRVLLSMPACTGSIALDGEGIMIATATIGGKTVTLKVMR
ncbi:MAG TPA: hypothetical protein DC009_08075 [Porphyromonadaceae bacterium]|nr:hypothetical protein [Porphyromonadaceae bacterium]